MLYDIQIPGLVSTLLPIYINHQGSRASKTFHADALEKVQGRAQPLTACDWASDEGEYNVEHIHSDRIRRGIREYLVEWEDYPKRQDWTWESASKLIDEDGNNFAEVDKYWSRK